MKKLLSCLLAAFLLAGYNSTDREYPTFPGKPSRAAENGFKWEVVEGAGLKFWAQENGYIRIVPNDSLPGAEIEWNDSVKVYRSVIRIFPIHDARIDGVLPLLKKMPGWEDYFTCRFEKVRARRQGVNRYVLIPTGKYAEEMNVLGETEPIPSTCNGWGIGNSGIRYFEIHDNCPDKALFIEIGQDAPLFDEESIILN